MKKRIRKIAIWTAVIAAVLLTLHFIFLETGAKYTFYFISGASLVALFAFLGWKAFVERGRQDLKESEKQRVALEGELQNLRQQFAELSRSTINVTGISPILHLSVLEIDTSFTRSYIRNTKDQSLSFNGALRADICAEYGVRLEDVRFRYDEKTGTLYMANFNPGLISFSKKQLTWDIARSYHKRDILGLIELSPADDDEAEAFTKRMKEVLRSEIEKEIDERKLAEFEWLSPIVSRQVTDMIKLAIGRPETTVVILEGETPDGFIDFNTLYTSIQGPDLPKEIGQ